MCDKGPKGKSCYEDLVISALMYCGLQDKHSLDYIDIYRLIRTMQQICFRRKYILSASLHNIIIILKEDLHYNVSLDSNNIF